MKVFFFFLLQTYKPQLYLVGQVNHTEVGLQLKAEGGQGRGASLGPGELVEYDGVFRVQLFLLSVWTRERQRRRSHGGRRTSFHSHSKETGPHNTAN